MTKENEDAKTKTPLSQSVFQRFVINAVSLFVVLPFWFLCIGAAILMAWSNAREDRFKAAWREMIDYPGRTWKEICRTW